MLWPSFSMIEKLYLSIRKLFKLIYKMSEMCTIFRRHVSESGPLAFLANDFAQRFGEIVSVKTGSTTNLVASWHI